jgi:putative MATE family efflux protein
MTPGNEDILSGNIGKTFFSYSIPNVLSLLAISSSGVVDGFFVGNYAGAASLAAINLVIPFYSLIYAICIMLTTGGSVRCAKYLGEKNQRAAASIFSKTLIIIISFSFIITLIAILFPASIAFILGAKGELIDLSIIYIQYLSLFTIFFLGVYSLSTFIRIEGGPIWASVSIISGALCNVLLDWLLVGKWGMGLKGAALATGGAQVISMIMMLFFYLTKRNLLYFTLSNNGWNEIWKACYNGISEFTNELSGGLIILLFNWIMITQFGVPGVAAFTVINYTIWIGLMVFWGISESSLPLISTNFGARQPERIVAFLKYAFGSTFFTGLVLFFLLFSIPDYLIGLFLQPQEIQSIEIAQDFTIILKWAFLFNGLNIIFSAYFTAMHKPLESTLVAITRSLFLPAMAVMILPVFIGETGIYIAIPLAEILTFVIALYFFYKLRPSSFNLTLNTKR